MRCGVWYPSTEIKKEWTGLHVCSGCYETRHEQTLIKVRGEKTFPNIVNKDGTDTFIGTCNIATKTAYTDLGTADCAQADLASPPYAAVFDLFKNGHGGM